MHFQTRPKLIPTKDLFKSLQGTEGYPYSSRHRTKLLSLSQRANSRQALRERGALRERQAYAEPLTLEQILPKINGSFIKDQSFTEKNEEKVLTLPLTGFIL